jgi:hypothetical protein
MELSRLFLFPKEFHTVIETLAYLFCRMLHEPSLELDTQNLRIEPSNKPRRHLFWKSAGNILYTPYPAWWKIFCHGEEKKLKKYHCCPYRLDHQMMELFDYIVKSCNDRAAGHHGFRKLQGLFRKLEEEYDFHGCVFCGQLEKEIKDLGYPVDLLVDYYTGWKEDEGDVEVLREILKPHVEYCEVLMRQTRSAQVRKDLLRMLSRIYEDHKAEYETAVLSHADLRSCYDKFSKDMQSALINRIPFLSLKKIDFDAWFRSLFYFQLELRDLSHPETKNKILFCKKVLFLLYYLFPEEVPEPEELEGYPSCFLIETGKRPQKLQVPGNKMFEYHPMIRGAVVQELSFS